MAKTTLLTIDLDGALRRRKPEKRISQLKFRDSNQLLGPSDAPPGPVGLVLDTTVYIHDAAGTLPSDVKVLVDRALLFHCAVCFAELATGISNADPQHPGWIGMRAHYTEVLSAVPEHRLLVPDQSIWLDAGVLAGTLARTQRLQRNQRKEILNDALIFLTAAHYGLPVLTANRGEFDLLQQLAPEGTFYFY